MTTTTALIPDGHSRPIGKYSPGILLDLAATGGLVFVSGQVATDHRGEVLGRGDVAAQAEGSSSDGSHRCWPAPAPGSATSCR